MLPDNIHLLHIGGGAVDWRLGETIQTAPNVEEIIVVLERFRKQNKGWLLCWHQALGSPDIDLIKMLVEESVDVWHAGLMCGLDALPDVLNYVHPTWMYNKNAAKDTEHSSFRLSIRACLINIHALAKLDALPARYSSIDMFGIALGYKMLKQGAIVRYSPKLVGKEISVEQPSLYDEWVFARQFFSAKWQVWTLLNKKGFTANYKNWIKTSSVKKQIATPSLHSSLPSAEEISAEKVSVLAPTLNRYSYLMNELEQLSVQTILPYEVLITDQTDKADRQQLDFSKYPNLAIRYFPQEEKGQCIAWNKLLQEAKGDYVLFLGDDADGIEPNFIEKLLTSLKRFDCDMVASNVIEIGIPQQPVNHHYYMADTFPIALIKRSVVAEAGFMDMFFNRNIRADHDLAMRCHLNGSRMIFDSSAVILHHRAPVGGLRTHNARVITNHISRNSLTKFAVPASSEIYLVKKYYSPLQYKTYIRIKYFNQLMVTGGLFRKVLRTLVFLYKLPSIRKSYKTNLLAAEKALAGH